MSQHLTEQQPRCHDIGCVGQFVNQHGALPVVQSQHRRFWTGELCASQRVARISRRSRRYEANESRELFFVQGQTIMSVNVTETDGLEFDAPREVLNHRWVNQDLLAVAPDGQSFLVLGLSSKGELEPPVRSAGPPLTIVMNWRAFLE
jgi:hypothetical protein